MINTQNLTTAITTLGFLSLLLLVSAETYYITPTSSAACPNESTTCMTLNNFVKENHVAISNTNLYFLPGNHSLESILHVNNIENLILQARSKSAPASVTTTVTCHNSSLVFINISMVNVSGLVFNGCTGNTVRLVKTFTIENCKFQYGQGMLLMMVNGKIKRSMFLSIRSRTIDKRILDQYLLSSHIEYIPGLDITTGAIASVESSIEINNCLFDRNEAAYGGGIGSVDSNIIVIESNFTLNRAYHAGGAIITILSSMARHNATMIFDSNFTSNKAKVGGAIKGIEAKITIHNSKFLDNIATRDDGGAIEVLACNLHINSTQFLANRANRRGGVLWTRNTSLTLSKCIFKRNTAIEYYRVGHRNPGEGGAIYIESSKLRSSGFLFVTHTKAVSGTIFAVGSTLLFAGKTNFANNNAGLFFFSSSVTFDGNTTMVYNDINAKNNQDSGAMKCFQSNVSFKNNVLISHNQVHNGSGGGIFLTESKIYTFGNTTISHNKALSGGGIHAYQSELNIVGHTSIQNNSATENGGGIHAIGSAIKLSREQLQLVSNKAKRGGGMYLELNAKLYVIKTRRECSSNLGSRCSVNIPENERLRFEFTDNSADYGGALYISDNTSIGACAANSGQSMSSECFFQTLALHSDTFSTLNVKNTYFADNSAAKSGRTIFGGLLDRCTVSPYAEIFNKYPNLSLSSLNVTSYLTKVTNLIPPEISSEISSEPVRVCICKQGHPECSNSPTRYQVKKGETIHISVVAVDQVNNPVPSQIRAFLSDGGLGEGQAIQNTTSNCTELNYTVSSPLDSEQLFLYASGPCNDIGISQTQINVEFIPCSCPIGFNISETEQSNCVCDCDPKIYPKYITSCSIANHTIQRKDNIWISHVNTPDQKGYLTYLHCPFDYCNTQEQVRVNLNIPNGADTQCAFNRSGKLCGSCKDGLSLSLGSSHCMQCSNNWLALLIVFALAGIALVTFILVCNLTVAVGTINGLIFYGNILATSRATLLPLQNNNILTVFIAWLNLDFGFMTCFYDGMDGYAKEWLQLAFPLYILFIVAMVILTCEYSTKIAKIFTKTNPVATLATLILLSYTKSLRVIIAALSSATLEYPDGSHEIVWLTDANISYFEGKHIPLCLVALLILLVGITYTVFLFFYQWLLLCSDKRALTWLKNAKIYPFMDAYHAPYNGKHRYWTGLLLLIRIFLYIAATVSLNQSGNPSIILFIITTTMLGVCLIKMAMFGRIYKEWALDVLESSFILNAIVFTVATLYIREAGGNQAALANTSTSIAFITFLATLLYHAHTYILQKRIIKFPKNKIENANGKDSQQVPENKCTSNKNSTSSYPLANNETASPNSEQRGIRREQDHIQTFTSGY